MKHLRSSTAVLVLATFLVGAGSARAQSTAFTYQGNLVQSGSAATGAYDFQFALYTNSTGGSAVATITNPAVAVSNGLFTSALDFGNAFNGSTLYLDIAIRSNGYTGSFTELSARQPVTASPYALYAPSAGNVTGVLAVTNLPSTVALLNSSPVFTGAVTATSFSGNGAGLTNLTSSPTNGDYLFAYDNTVQTFTSGAGNYQTVTFNTPAQMNGWTPASVGPNFQYFTCPAAGLYLFQYAAEILGAGGRTVTFRAGLNNTPTEIPGSEAAVTLASNTLTAISKSFMTNLNTSDQFKLQFTTDGTGTVTLTNSIVNPVRPDVTLTIIRIN